VLKCLCADRLQRYRHDLSARADDASVYSVRLAKKSGTELLQQHDSLMCASIVVSADGRGEHLSPLPARPVSDSLRHHWAPLKIRAVLVAFFVPRHRPLTNASIAHVAGYGPHTPTFPRGYARELRRSRLQQHHRALCTSTRVPSPWESPLRPSQHCRVARLDAALDRRPVLNENYL
jgi:hypothetical protein